MAAELAAQGHFSSMQASGAGRNGVHTCAGGKAAGAVCRALGSAAADGSPAWPLSLPRRASPEVCSCLLCCRASTLCTAPGTLGQLSYAG